MRILLVCLFALNLFGQQPQREGSPPNVLLIFTDDMGYADLGCYGGTFAPTPNIDRLASNGLRLTQFYVAAPVCSPSRVGILTGMHPARWRITNYLQTRAGNRASEQEDFLDPNAPTLAHALKKAGYATGHFGKWHMGGGRDVTNAPPFRRYGFDEHASTWESPEPDPALTATNWVWSARDKVKRWERTAYFVDKALDFMKRHRAQPVYVNLWPDDVHTPWVPNQSAVGRKSPGYESQTNFVQVLAEYDRQIGRLLDGLAQLELENNTLVIFTSDNGPEPAFAGARTGGLRGSKISLYEGGTRVPFIVRWPGHVPANRTDSETIMSALDLFPTICALADVHPPKEPNLDGEDLSRALLGKPMSRNKPIFWEYGRNTTTGFHYPQASARSPNLAVREGPWKLLLNADGSGVELYDLNQDQNETRNVAATNLAVTARLTDAVLNWRKSVP